MEHRQRLGEKTWARDAILDVLLAPTRHLFISPHYDDIALSCGGTVALLARYRRRPRIAVVFGEEPPENVTLTRFASETHAAWGLGPREVVAARRREEADAADRLGAEVTVLPFHDAIYRGHRYVGEDALFGVPAPDEQDLPSDLTDELNLDLDQLEETRVYAPLGVGKHVDHQIAFSAGIVLASAGWEVWFYEDLPYAFQHGARDDRLETVGQQLRVAAEVDVSGTWQTKLAAIMAYPSQITTVFKRAGSGASRQEIDACMRDYARRGSSSTPVERFWRLDPHHTSTSST